MHLFYTYIHFIKCIKVYRLYLCASSNSSNFFSTFQDSQSRASENSEMSAVYSSQEAKTRPAPPKKPLRLSLHRAASLQSVESAPPAASQHDIARKPTKRNHRGDPPEKIASRHPEMNGNANSNPQESHAGPPQPPPRTPSRAESCQSALRWPSPKPRAHLTSMPMEKWC